MLNTRILNPQLLSLLARVRHTNALVIADKDVRAEQRYWATGCEPARARRSSGSARPIPANQIPAPMPN